MSLTLSQVQKALDGMIEPTVIVKKNWLTWKATQSWAQCGEAFKAAKEKHDLKSLFYRGGVIGIRAANVTVEKPGKAPKAAKIMDTASVLASFMS
jgi:hypothetical protein